MMMMMKVSGRKKTDRRRKMMKMMMSAGKNGRQNSENGTLPSISQTNLQANVVYKYKLLMTLALACKA